jgi:enoyl-CoA hydratase/carnithine racemase
MTAPPSLHIAVSGATARLRFDHGKANEMGRAQIAELEAVCDLLEEGRVQTLLTWSDRRSAKGAPIFVAGANVTERTDWSPGEVRAHVRRQRELLVRLRHAPVFHVAVVHGVALGWGTEFMIACDWRIATPGARFALPETGLGILPGAGGASELQSLIGPTHTLRLGMTGELIDAAEAHRIGLVDEVAADLPAGLARAEAMAARMATRSPTAAAAFKAAVLASIGLPPEDRREREARAYEHCLATGEAAIGRDNFAAILAGDTPEWGPFQRFLP